MIRSTALAACLAVVFSMGSGTAFAEPEPAPPPPIDWRDFIDTDMNGDHVVGEELCAVPVTVESVPESFVLIRHRNIGAA